MYALNYFDYYFPLFPPGFDYYYFPFFPFGLNSYDYFNFTIFPFGLNYYDFFDFPMFKPGINRTTRFVLNKTFKRIYDKLESIRDLDSALDSDDEDDLV